MIDALCGFLVIRGFGEEDVGNKGLRIPVVEGKPAGLHLYHDAMAGKKDVVRRGQCEAIKQGLIRGYGLSLLKAFAITSAEIMS